MASASRQLRWVDYLSDEDLAFLRRFVLASGSLKEVAAGYGISYPTVRLRLDRLIAKITVIESNEITSEFRRARAQHAEGKIDAETLERCWRRIGASRSLPTLALCLASRCSPFRARVLPEFCWDDLEATDGQRGIGAPPEQGQSFHRLRVERGAEPTVTVLTIDTRNRRSSLRTLGSDPYEGVDAAGYLSCGITFPMAASISRARLATRGR